ncbi:MAG: RNA polymerase factor sigma-32 [Deltaproteobacteria bacterium]|nr:RNA polymerase factor sigma-32 [Deltaproteobacteria bacterium]
MGSESDATLSRYISRVKDLPSFTREEEHALALKVRDERDAGAAEALVRANMRYVVAIAVQYRRYDLRLGDLVSEGNVGLVTAVKKFDPDKGTRFVTYAAYWIRAYILNHVIRSWSMVGSGSGPLRSKMFFRLRRERARIANMVGDGSEALDALAAQLGTSRERLDEMMQRLEGRDVSLDQAAFQDSKVAAVDLLEDPTAPQDERLDLAVREALLDHRVQSALSHLDARERFIVEHRMMADEELSLAELGRRLGVSRERARQLEARARRKLRTRLEDLKGREE